MGLEYLPLDLETTGLHPVKKEIVSCVFGDFAQIQNKYVTELDLLMMLAEYTNGLNKNMTTILTYNGGTIYSNGFDGPFLRVRYLINGLTWPFKGFNHIDLYPIITKFFDLDFDELGKLEDLNAADLKKFAIHFGLKAETTIKNNIASVKENVEEDQINEYLNEIGLMKNKSHNGLKDACLHLLGIKDFGVDGRKVPGMFANWKETGDDSIIDTILEYNKDDCVKTMKLFEAIKPVVSNRILSGELL